MTREEAQKELAELEPRESEAWSRVVAETTAWENAYSDLRSQMERHVTNKPSVVGAVQKRWLPLHARKQQLKAFLELAP